MWYRQTRIRQPPLLHSEGDATVRPRERRPRIPNPEREREPSSKPKPTQQTELASPPCSHAVFLLGATRPNNPYQARKMRTIPLLETPSRPEEPPDRTAQTRRHSTANARASGQP